MCAETSMRLNIYKYTYSVLESPGTFLYMGSPFGWKEASGALRGLLPYIFALYVEGRLKKSS